ncbi:hypothetical protein DC20_19270 [Rufibacter tibetensis]|uniref:Uncharacterized protein n=1 Tax=Rufibacter tibetensis TaxID=512763 RepID=A0A0P0CZ18_9BACT|nr:hypothetical protein DC20_19270 [Rufibacter tibetensis]
MPTTHAVYTITVKEILNQKMNIQEKKRQRFEFLSQLYEVTSGSSSFNARTSSKEIGKILNLNRETIDRFLN